MNVLSRLNVGFSFFTLLISSSAFASWADGTPGSYYFPDSTQNVNQEPKKNSKPTQTSMRRGKDLESRQALKPFAPDSHNLSVGLGQIFLLSDQQGTLGDSLGVQSEYTYGVSKLLGYQAALSHSNHSNGKYSLTQIRTGTRLNLGTFDQMIPYVNAGIGFNRASSNNLGSSQSAILFGVYGGAGIDLRISPEVFFGTSLNWSPAFQSSSSSSTLGASSMQFLGKVGYTF